eukprot:4019384-Pyramimonas_sp.AAC.1
MDFGGALLANLGARIMSTGPVIVGNEQRRHATLEDAAGHALSATLWAGHASDWNMGGDGFFYAGNVEIACAGKRKETGAEFSVPRARSARWNSVIAPEE